MIAVPWVYFDASALVKRYSTETGTPLVNELFSLIPVSQMRCSLLAVLEIVAVLVRKRNDGRLSEALFNQALSEFWAEVVDQGSFVGLGLNDKMFLSSLELIPRHNLNATDAAVLQSALDFRRELQAGGGELVLCTSDKRMARAAAAEGLTGFDPEIETSAGLRRTFGLEPA